VCAVFGCGIDVEELKRFDRYVGAGDDSIMQGICSPREFDNLCGDRRLRFALSFSCKEAFFKALGMSWTNSAISWRDIELLFNGSDLCECCVHLHGHAKDVVARHRLCVGEACFACNEDYAVFQVVLLAGEAARALLQSECLHVSTGSDKPICRPRYRAAGLR